ncbi:MAG: hypothetical protein ACE5LB_01985 [Acidiferrobacterales bacterium]
MEYGAGESTEPRDKRLHVQSRAEARDIINQLFAQARRQIVIFAPALDGYFFNTSHVGQTLASFAAAHRNNMARVLVEHTSQAVRDNGRLVELCRRFTNFIKMRQVDEDDFGLREMFVIIDNSAYLHQRDVERVDYVAALDAPRDARLLAVKYTRLWERSHSIASILTLGL